MLLPFLSELSCGYKVGGKSSLIPAGLLTIAVPPFSNPTSRYKLTEKLPAAISRELISRTRYQILPSLPAPGDPPADAILKGSILSATAIPLTSNAILLNVVLSISLTQTNTGAVLYANPSLDFRQRYEISTDPQAYFDESSFAFERLSRDVARSVVTAIIENF